MTDAPTPRETADHAELARLAEAATQGEWTLDGHQCLSAPDGTIVVDYSCSARGTWEADAAYLLAVQPSRVAALLNDAKDWRAEWEATSSARIQDRETLLSEIAALRAKTDPANWKDREDEWSKAVEAAHPVNSTDPDRHKHFDTAMSMVGNRHGKYELVGLVHWLLTRALQAERQRDELRKALERIADEAPYRSGYCQSDVECGPTLSADEMQAVARQAIANQGTGQ